MDTQQKGEYAQLKVQQRAVEFGFIVSVPTVDTRYDLILDDGKQLLKVQVKYADGSFNDSSGSVRLDLRRWAGDKRTETRNYQRNEVDAILVYIPKIDDICWLPPALFHDKPALSIRYEPTRSGQKANIHFASDLIWKNGE